MLWNWKTRDANSWGGFKKFPRVWNGQIKTQLKSTNKKLLKSWPQCQPLKCQKKVANVTNVNPEKDRCSLEGLEGFQKLKIVSETGLFFEDGFKTLSSPPWTQKGSFHRIKIHWLLQGLWRELGVSRNPETSLRCPTTKPALHKLREALL